jgi:hypothetical protein
VVCEAGAVAGHAIFDKISIDFREFIAVMRNRHNSGGYYAVVERLTKSDQAYAVAAAAAHGFNEELTVILSSVSHCLENLEPGHPARQILLDLQVAAERCARTTSGLLAYGFSRGLRPVPTRFDALIAN